MATTKKPDLTTMTEAEKLAALQTSLLDSFLLALSGTKTPPSALLIAASRYLSSEPIQAALKKHQAATKKVPNITALTLPVFPPDEYDDIRGDASGKPQEGTGATIPAPRYVDHEDLA
jgi:hypothetical protein